MNGMHLKAAVSMKTQWWPVWMLLLTLGAPRPALGGDLYAGAIGGIATLSADGRSLLSGFEPPGLQFVLGARCCWVVFGLGAGAKADLPAYITWITVLRPLSTSCSLRKTDSLDRSCSGAS